MTSADEEGACLIITAASVTQIIFQLRIRPRGKLLIGHSEGNCQECCCVLAFT